MSPVVGYGYFLESPIKAVVLSLCEGFFVVCPNINIHQKELYFCIRKLEDFFPLFRLPLTSIGFDS